MNLPSMQTNIWGNSYESLWVQINRRQITVLFEIWRIIFNALKEMPSIWRPWRHIKCQLKSMAYLSFSVSSCKDKPRSFADSSYDFYLLRIVWDLVPIQIWISRWESWRLRSFLRSTHIFGTPYCFPSPENEIYSTMPRRSSINEFSDILQRRGDCDRWKPTSSPFASHFTSLFSCHFSLFLSPIHMHIYISKWNYEIGKKCNL